MIRVGIWGCGGISAMHRRGYQTLKERGIPGEVVALCDINPANFNNEIKINLSNGNSGPLEKIKNCYTDIDKMIENENLDIIDICLPTFLHKDATIKALEKGINVIVEKPMAMTYQESKEMLEAEKRSGKRLMVAHCVRFSKIYAATREAINGGEYGKLICADFARLSSVPMWRMSKGGPNKGRIDGVILDMHIHDVDYVQSILGMPKAISAVASKNNYTFCDSVCTILKYDDGYVNIRGDWGLPQTFPFTTTFRVNLQRAAFVGHNGDNLKMYRDGGVTELITENEDNDDITSELDYFIDIVMNDKENTVNPPEQSANSMRLVEMIEESVKHNGKTIFVS